MSVVRKFGDNVDTDQIIPARYLVTTDEKELARNCMEAIDPEFGKQDRSDVVIVAGSNFGCGSSREHAPISIKGTGVTCVIAKSFARIFLRNSVNIGLNILECPEAADRLGDGDIVTVDLKAGVIRADRKAGGLSFQATPMPEFVRDIIDAGGLMAYTKRRLAERA